MHIYLSTLNDIFSQKHGLNLDKNFCIKHICVDSRKVLEPMSTVFVALKGQQVDGHIYINQLISDGVKVFIVTHLPDKNVLEKACFYLVENSIKALQHIATIYKNQFDLKTIAITGSNGKTIIKEWLYQLLEKQYQTVRSPKSYNSQIGVPLSVFNIELHHQIGIFEAGISMPGEMSCIQDIIKAEIGILSNLGDAHQENFENLKQKFNEKIKLFETAKTLIYCTNNVQTNEWIEEWHNAHKQIEIISWGFDHLNQPKIKIDINEKEQLLSLHFNDTFYEFKIPFNDKASLENICHCIVCALYLGISETDLQDAISKLLPIEMRLQQLEGYGNSIIINDTYNADMVSLQYSIDRLNQLQNNQKSILILSDIQQLGLEKDTLYKTISQIIVKSRINHLIAIGSDFETYKSHFEKQTFVFENYITTATCLKHIQIANFANAIILVKGSRKFEMEKIVDVLALKKHQTVVNIHLNHIVHNLQIIKTKIEKGKKIMAMVKANSYGAGSVEIAKVLQNQHVDYLAVAYTDEGIELRQNGIYLPIMVMNPEIHTFSSMLEYDLQPEIYSIPILEKLIESCKQNGILECHIHIELDTGMHRLGFENQDFKQLIALLNQNTFIKVKSVFTHLASSEDSTFDAFTLQQKQTFDQMVQILKQAIPYPFITHINNTAATMRQLNADADMVRLGIGLYGIDTSGMYQNQLKLSSQFRSYISQIRTVAAGEGISYNLYSKSNQDRTIAVVAIGYADGLPRQIGKEKHYLKVNNMPCKIVGSICMDMCMIDITNVGCKVGDEVIIFETAEDLIEIAKQSESIPYAILTSISNRVKRVFWYD